jgi:hypothetical protein
MTLDWHPNEDLLELFDYRESERIKEGFINGLDYFKLDELLGEVSSDKMVTEGLVTLEKIFYNAQLVQADKVKTDNFTYMRKTLGEKNALLFLAYLGRSSANSLAVAHLSFNIDREKAYNCENPASLSMRFGGQSTRGIATFGLRKKQLV